MDNTKEPIRLRRRKLPSGNTTLYLDIYIKGRREYEYLHLYLIPEKNRTDKERNRETLKLADAIRAKRVVELRNKEYDFKNGYAEETLFFEYFQSMCDKRHSNPDSKGNWKNWCACLRHLQIYEKRQDITFTDITPRWIEGFKIYMETMGTKRSRNRREPCTRKPLSRNTQSSYFAKLSACLNRAYEDGIIRTNPLRGVGGIPQEESTRMYLTLDEIKLLAQAECKYPEVKKAFLFSCLTGLRRSDIVNLTWKDVHQQGEYTRIIFKQKKTKGLEYLDIAKQAADLIGERKNGEEFVFGNILSPKGTNDIIREWVSSVGIDKKITFHCGRHTFATMMLDIGTDIYTVSKLLGHRELSTTQIYAKVMDKNKQAAVANIPDVFGTMKTAVP